MFVSEMVQFVLSDNYQKELCCSAGESAISASSIEGSLLDKSELVTTYADHLVQRAARDKDRLEFSR